MKRIIGLVVCLLALSACGSGSNEKSVTCKVPSTDTLSGEMTLKYGEDQKGTKLEMVVKQKTTKEVLENKDQMKAIKDTASTQAKAISGTTIDVSSDLSNLTLDITYHIDLKKYDHEKDALGLMSTMGNDKSVITAKKFVSASKQSGMECGEIK